MCDEFDGCDVDTGSDMDTDYDTDSDVGYEADGDLDVGYEDGIEYDTDVDEDIEISCDEEADLGEDCEAEDIADLTEEADTADDFDADIEPVDLADEEPQEFTDEMLESYLQAEQSEMSEEENVKVLRRDPDELMDVGMSNVEDILDVRRDDMLDKGMSEDEIAEALARERVELQQEFVRDAFPSKETEEFASEDTDLAEEEMGEETEEFAPENADLAEEVVGEETEELASEDTDLAEEEMVEETEEFAPEDVDLAEEEMGEETEEFAPEDADLAEEEMGEETEELASEDTDLAEEEMVEETEEFASEDADLAEEEMVKETEALAPTDADLGETELEETEESIDIAEEEDLMRDVVRQNVQDVRLPVSGGEWENPEHIGDGLWRPNDETEFHWRKGDQVCSMTGAEFRERYGVEGVTYQDGEPDFEPFEDEVLGHVELEDMPDHRDGADGSYRAATHAAAQRLGVSEAEVEHRMEEQGLTWHECGDRSTVRAIPTGINAAFPHTGGISIQRGVEAMAEGISDRYGEVALSREELGGQSVGIKNAHRQTQDFYRRKKNDL